MKIITVGTRNRDKLREIQDLLVDVPVSLQTVPADVPEAVEDAPTLEGNAAKKAREYAAAVGTWCLADDTGLEVDALGGAPGVLSARYAGEDATYADNRRKLLDALADVPEPRRTARFRCVVVLANPAGEVLAQAEGVLEGTITREERGAGGFGYDAIFLPHPPAGGPADSGARTLGELSAEEKNRLSHRGLALRALRPHLLELL